jgi:hypothetical protein
MASTCWSTGELQTKPDLSSTVIRSEIPELITVKPENIDTMTIRLINTILILYAIWMGIKQGWAMFSSKPEMFEMFERWNFSMTDMMVQGGFTLLSALLIVYPKTFLLGNFLMAAGILLLICLQLSSKDLKGAVIELPFLMMNLLILYLGHPLARTN